MPLVFALGLVMALGCLAGGTRSGLRSWLGPAAALSLAAATAPFVLAAWITPVANQACRQRAFRWVLAQKAQRGEDVTTTPDPRWLSKGPRELTLGELDERVAAARASGESTVRWDVERHKKWALAAGCLS